MVLISHDISIYFNLFFQIVQYLTSWQTIHAFIPVVKVYIRAPEGVALDSHSCDSAIIRWIPRQSGIVPYLWNKVWKICLLDDVIKWSHFPRPWPFIGGIHRSPVNSHKDQWHGALMFSLIYAWINDWVNNREAGDLRRHRPHFDAIVMILGHIPLKNCTSLFKGNPNSLKCRKFVLKFKVLVYNFASSITRCFW